MKKNLLARSHRWNQKKQKTTLINIADNGLVVSEKHCLTAQILSNLSCKNVDCNMNKQTYKYLGTGYPVTRHVSQAVLSWDTTRTFQPSYFSPSFLGGTLFVGSTIKKYQKLTKILEQGTQQLDKTTKLFYFEQRRVLPNQQSF